MSESLEALVPYLLVVGAVIGVGLAWRLVVSARSVRRRWHSTS
jgi:hypothetical protein